MASCSLHATCWCGCHARSDVALPTYMRLHTAHFADRVRPPALLGAEGGHPEQGVHVAQNAGSSRRGLFCKDASFQHVLYTEDVHGFHGYHMCLLLWQGAMGMAARSRDMLVR